ncbi:hypothetical protein Tco_0630926 [Tanacetum coccineum]
MILELLRDAFPHITSLPSSAHQTKKLTNEPRGHGYNKRAMHVRLCAKVLDPSELDKMEYQDVRLCARGVKIRKGMTLFSELDYTSLAQAHRYVLLNHSKIQHFREFLQRVMKSLSEDLKIQVVNVSGRSEEEITISDLPGGAVNLIYRSLFKGAIRSCRFFCAISDHLKQEFSSTIL